MFGDAGNAPLTGGKLGNTIDGGRGTFDGGAGTDTMRGGTGNDTYIVTGLNDTIVEHTDFQYGNQVIRYGLDTVDTYVSGYVLDDNVETLNTRGTALSASGNELNNVMRGSSRNNTRFGRDGDELIMGGLGSDRLIGGEGSDRLVCSHSNLRVLVFKEFFYSQNLVYMRSRDFARYTL